jgi:C-terminal peptidase prc
LGAKSEDDDGPPKPIVVLAANGGLEPSVQLEKHGLFMTVVLEALQGKADKEGGEADGLVTVDELSEHFHAELLQRVKAQAKLDAHWPVVRGTSTHFAITKNPAVTAQVAERLEKFETVLKASKLNGEIAREGRDFLSRMPRPEMRELRQQYVKLAEGKLSAEDFLKSRTEYLQGLKVSRAEARTFADKVLRVGQLAQEAYVKPVTLADLTAAAIKGLYRRADEKLPKEIEDRLAKIKQLDEDGLRNLLADARQALGKREKLKGSKAVDVALEMMLHDLDNHSIYIDPERVEEYKKEHQRVFIGVGIQIQRDLSRDLIRVSTPLRGSPAYHAGIKAGDYITKVTNVVDRSGKRLPEPVTVSTKGMKSEDAVKTITGQEGTMVTLHIEREEKDGVREFPVEIRRGRVESETVIGVRRDPKDDSWDFYLDSERKIAYIRLSQFALNTERHLRDALRKLGETGINGLILDLRFNPGGYLDSAVKISDLFIDDGLIVTIRPREGRPTEYRGRHAGSLLNFPLVVLVNRDSASASEIVSAAIQDHERGIVMGERSFGKGSVQNVMELNLGEGTSEVKLTIASFWRPNNKNLNRFPTSKETDDWGVVPHPDYTIRLTPSERAELYKHLNDHEVIPRRDGPKKEPPASTFKDRQLEKAIEYLRGQVAGNTAVKRAG